jgi:putative transferase (TIGR04331 family)
MIPYHLVTTADERTWKFDRPILFLGEWCRLYTRTHIWENMDAVVAAPYGLGQVQKDADHAEARGLEERLLPLLCDALNDHHGTRHGQRFWRLVLGHWLRRFVEVTLNRVRTIESCLQVHRLSGTTAFSNEGYSLATLDSLTAIWAFSDDRWNNALYVRLLNLLGVIHCPVEVIPGDNVEGFHWPATEAGSRLEENISRLGYEQVGKLFRLFARESDALIFSTYLPKIEAVKLNFALGQIPQLWARQQHELKKKPDSGLRARLSSQIPARTGGAIFEIMATLVFELLPVCYLEGFADLAEKARHLGYPSKPKFIFASNRFDTDELFKVWLANKTESGVKYVAGQHGNNYGTYRYSHPSIEEATADKFLTWGWTDGLPQHTPAFIFKTAGCKGGSYAADGGLLLIELSPNHRVTTWDGMFEFGEYFKEQQRFIEALQRCPREQLTLRLHSEYRYKTWSEPTRWQEFDSGIKIELGASPIRQLISQCRLVIHSYDSTGILEMLSQDIPMLAFWQNGFDHVRDSARPYYQMLVDAGIVHLTPESAATKVNEVWDVVGDWWAQRSVQEARRLFCDRYARTSQSPIHELKNMLMDDIS